MKTPVAEQLSNVLTWVLWVSGTAVVLMIIGFLAIWMITKTMPRSRSTQQPDNAQQQVGTALAWVNLFKD